MNLLKRLLGVALLSLLAVAAVAETPQIKSLSTVRAQIDQVLAEKEARLHDLDARYAAAPLDQRTALEAESHQLQTDYQRRYLELLIDYHQLSGNARELARAERMLESLNAGTVEGTPQTMDRNRQEIQPPSNPAQTPVEVNNGR